MGSSRKIIQRATLRVGISSLGEICGRAVNLFLPFAVIAVHGTNSLTDSFFLSMAVAFFIQGTLANVSVTVLVSEFILNEEKRNLYEFFRWAVVAGVLASLVSGILATELLTPTAALISAASVAVLAVSGLTAAPAVAALNANHRYGMPGLTWGLRLIPVSFYMLWWPETPSLHWLLFGLALADVMRMSILLWLARNWISLRRNCKTLHFPKAAQYLIFASAIAGFTPLLARWIASFGSAGSVSLFEAADRIYAAVASLATIGVGNVTLVYLARLNGTDQEHKGWRLILWSSIAWSLLWLCIGILLWVAFPYVSTWIHLPIETVGATVRYTFLALVFGIPGFIMSGMLSRRLITLGFSKSLIFITIAGLFFSLVCSTLLFPIIDIIGIAVALSCSQYLVVLLMFRKLIEIPANAHSCSS